MKLIVGLGNPGAAYKGTRHNLGFLVLDKLAGPLDATFSREKFRGLWAEGHWRGQRVLLLKPMTHMNRSGESVALAARNKIPDSSQMLVVYDDIELPLGTLRLRASGSAGTHNGMKSVLERLGTRDVPRLRLGVGGQAAGQDLAEHVLSAFRPEEKPSVDDMLERATKAALSVLDEGIDAAMTETNRRT